MTVVNLWMKHEMTLCSYRNAEEPNCVCPRLQVDSIECCHNYNCARCPRTSNRNNFTLRGSRVSSTLYRFILYRNKTFGCKINYCVVHSSPKADKNKNFKNARFSKSHVEDNRRVDCDTRLRGSEMVYLAVADQKVWAKMLKIT